MNPPPALFPIFAASALILTSARAGEFFTLVAKNLESSATITLNAGDTAGVKYAPTIGISLYLIATIEGVDYPMHATPSGGTAPPTVAGPAFIRLRQNGFNENAQSFATIEVNRAGTASNATAIPQEAGATWQVILEASTDLVNWTPVPPGDYPANSPQRFFRTRLVKRQ